LQLMHCDECIGWRALVASENRKCLSFLDLFGLLPVLSAVAKV